MIECKLILPHKDNDGVLLSPVHLDLVRELIDTFGGVTATECVGWWHDPATAALNYDQNEQYVCALPERDKAVFQDIAITYAERAKQKSVYIALDGEVKIIDLTKLTAPITLPNSRSFDVVG